MVARKKAARSRQSVRRGAGDTQAPLSTDNRCRIVLIKRTTGMRCYMEWEPESEGDRLLASAAAVEHETQEKFYACVQYEKPIGEDDKTLVNLPPDPPLRLTAEQIVAMRQQSERQRKVLEYIKVAEQYQLEVDQREQVEHHRERSSKGGQKLTNKTEVLMDIYKAIAPGQWLTAGEFFNLAKSRKRVEFQPGVCIFHSDNERKAIVPRRKDAAEPESKPLESLLRTVRKRLRITKDNR